MSEGYGGYIEVVLGQVPEAHQSFRSLFVAD